MANPIVSRTELAVGGTPMTIGGTVSKTAFLLALSGVSAIGLFFYVLLSGAKGIIYPLLLVSIFSCMGLGLLAAFKPHLAKAIAVPYSLLEGVVLGSFALIGFSFSPTIPLTALAATFVTAAIMLGLYTTGIIQVTQKFRSIVTSATIAIALLYLVQLACRFIFGTTIPFLFDGGMIAVGFCIFVIIIASFNLLLDFDSIDQGVHYGVSKDFEWVYAMGILATLVWMFIEFTRLLSYLED